MTESILTGLALATAIWFVGALYLRGPDLRAFDRPRSSVPGELWQSFSTGDSLNDEHIAVIEAFSGATAILENTPRARHIALLRNYMDTMKYILIIL